MRFLIDAQLPPALARYLASVGHEAFHVADLGLLAAPDRDIWEHATEIDAAVITKDEDFVTMRALNRRGPPIIWVRIGNTTRRQVVARFALVFPAIVAALERGDTVIELS